MNEQDLYYNKILCYGDFFPLDIKLENVKDFLRWTEDNFEYVRYNPRKDIPRYGLSITSADGGVSGIPDLDSLIEYNKENNTTYGEKDFDVLTDVARHKDLKPVLDIFEGNIFRTHILKLGPGGYFPPHRDIYFNFDSFRLIIPLDNFNPPMCNFVLENQILQWEKGQMYFLNTAKTHYIFNASVNKPSYWIVINVNLNKHTFELLSRHLYHK